MLWRARPLDWVTAGPGSPRLRWCPLSATRRRGRKTAGHAPRISCVHAMASRTRMASIRVLPTFTEVITPRARNACSSTSKRRRAIASRVKACVLTMPGSPCRSITGTSNDIVCVQREGQEGADEVLQVVEERERRERDVEERDDAIALGQLLERRAWPAGVERPLVTIDVPRRVGAVHQNGMGRMKAAQHGRAAVRKYSETSPIIDGARRTSNTRSRCRYSSVELR